MVPLRLRSVITLLKRNRSLWQRPITATSQEAGQDPSEESAPRSTHKTTSVIPLYGQSERRAEKENKQNAVAFFGISDTGLKRTNNEDHFIVADLTHQTLAVEANRVILEMAHQAVGPQGTLFAVADGLGGHENGEIASHVAVEALAYSLFHQGQDSISIDQQLANAIQEAQRIIIRHIASTPSSHTMSTTLTAVHVGYNEMVVAQVGDSRAYKFSKGILTQLTEDQTFVHMMLKKGLITAEEARTHPERHIILQALGQKNAISPSIQRFPFKFGDRLLLCSDGLSSYVSHEKIEAILNQETDENTCCQRLLEAAYTGGGGDNITILLARLLISPADPV